jgi:hypothetical protein
MYGPLEQAVRAAAQRRHSRCMNPQRHSEAAGQRYQGVTDSVVQQSLDIARAMQHGNDRERFARRIVADKAGVDRPELDRPWVRFSRR